MKQERKRKTRKRVNTREKRSSPTQQPRGSRMFSRAQRNRLQKTSQRPPNHPPPIPTKQQTILSIIHIQRKLRMDTRMPRLLQNLIKIPLRKREEREGVIRHRRRRFARVDNLTHVFRRFRYPRVALGRGERLRVGVRGGVGGGSAGEE